MAIVSRFWDKLGLKIRIRRHSYNRITTMSDNGGMTKSIDREGALGIAQRARTTWTTPFIQCDCVHCCPVDIGNGFKAFTWDCA